MDKPISALILSVLIGSMIFGMVNAAQNQSNQEKNITCPQYVSPAPDWCVNGTEVAGTINKDGCQGPPKCIKNDGTTVTINKTRIDKENITFIPWQKRNESECPVGC